MSNIIEPTVLDNGSVNRMILRKLDAFDNIVTQNITVKNTMSVTNMSLSEIPILVTFEPYAATTANIYSASELNSVLASRNIHTNGDIMFNATNGDVYYWSDGSWKLDGTTKAWTILKYPRIVTSVTGDTYAINSNSITKV